MRERVRDPFDPEQTESQRQYRASLTASVLNAVLSVLGNLE
jgi:hypothetical protein